MSYERILNNLQLDTLRKKSIITENEIALQAGDIFYAKNVLTDEKRVLSSSALESVLMHDTFFETKNESVTRKILKG